MMHRNTRNPNPPRRPWLAICFWVGLALIGGFGRGQGPPAGVPGGARAREPWLVVDPSRETVDVYVAGLLLERIAIEGVSVQSYHFASPTSSEELDLVTGFRVESPPSDLLGPTRLVTLTAPEDGGDFGGDEPGDEGTGTSTTIDLAPDRAPGEYEVDLDRGFVLVVSQGLTRPAWWRTLTSALVDQWSRWRGRPVAPRPGLLILEVESSVAVRLHPLLRPGTTIVLGASTAKPLGS